MAARRFAHVSTKLMQRAPFFGFLLNNFVIQETRNCPTMGVLPKQQKVFLYYNPDFLEKLNDVEAVAILEHECLHIAYEHRTRGRNKDQMIDVDTKGKKLTQKNMYYFKIWNIACDMEINQQLPDIPTEGEIAGVLPPDEWERGKAAEYYYDKLVEKMKDDPNSISVSMDMGDGESCPECGSQCGSQEGDEDGEGSGEGQGSESGESGDSEGEGGGSGGEQQQDVSKGSGGDNSCGSCGQEKSGSQDAQGSHGQGGGVSITIDGKTYQVGDMHDWDNGDDDPVTNEVVRDMVRKAMNEAKNIGKLPGGIEEKIQILHTKKERWDKFLKQRVWGTMSTDKAYKHRKDRRRKTFPASYSLPAVQVIIGLDTSGSTSEWQQSFLGSVRQIWKSLQQVDFWLVMCDTNVSIQKYNGEREFPINGWGGTDMRVLIDAVNEHPKLSRDKKKTFILFTDGYTPFYEDSQMDKIRKGGHTIIVYTPDGQKIENANWCKHIFMDKDL